MIGPGLDPADIPSYIGRMADGTEKRQGMWGWGISASILFHAVIAFVILVGIPFELPKPEAEEVVSVEIVPPQDEGKAEEPPAPAQEPEQQSQEPEPPPSPAQTPDEAAPAQPLDSFRPVFRFGEQDAGPKLADDGQTAEDNPETENPPEQQEQEEPQQAEQQPDTAPAGAAAESVEQQAEVEAETQAQDAVEPQESAEAPKTPDDAGAPVPNEITVPDVGLGPGTEEAAGIPVPAPAPRDDALKAEIAVAKPPASPETEQVVTPTERPAMPPAKRLFSPEATDNPMAAIAMSGMSAGERAAELCNTELREQLRHGSPSYSASVLPKPRLTGQNVIDVRSIGFRAREQWYDVSFRCEVDRDATRVTSFAHRVGGAIPKSEWRKRGFPSY